MKDQNILATGATGHQGGAIAPQIAKGILPEPLKPDTKLQQLSENDYGRMVAEVFERREEFLGAALEVASVTMTMGEAAETMSRVMERNVKYQQIPFEVSSDENKRCFEDGARDPILRTTSATDT